MNPAYRLISNPVMVRFPCPDCGCWHTVKLPFEPEVGYRFRFTSRCPEVLLEVVAARWSHRWQSRRGFGGITPIYAREQVLTA